MEDLMEVPELVLVLEVLDVHNVVEAVKHVLRAIDNEISDNAYEWIFWVTSRFRPFKAISVSFDHWNIRWRLIMRCISMVYSGKR
jgi:hypothetical protein